MNCYKYDFWQQEFSLFASSKIGFLIGFLSQLILNQKLAPSIQLISCRIFFTMKILGLSQVTFWKKRKRKKQLNDHHHSIETKLDNSTGMQNNTMFKNLQKSPITFHAKSKIH